MDHSFLQLGCFQFNAEHTSGEKEVNVIFRRMKLASSWSEKSKIFCRTESTKEFRSCRVSVVDDLVSAEGYAKSKSTFISSGRI